MKVVVTGASGFVGKSVLEVLSNSGDYEILALSRRDITKDFLIHEKKNSGSDSSKKVIENTDNVFAKKCKWITTDYSLESLRDIFNGVSVVVHLAGTKGTKTEMSDYDGDIEMTENILQVMVECHVSKIIYASSRLVYGNPENIPWHEDSPLEPNLPYGKCKVICENLCKKYSEKYGFSYTILRIAQVLGIGEGTKTMINVFQDLARAGQELKVIGKSVAKRQYIYVKDVAKIVEKITSLQNDLECDKKLQKNEERNGQEKNICSNSQILNIGMPKAYSNYEIAEIINEVFENKTPINYDDSQPETIVSSIMDISFLQKELEYTPENMKEALIDIQHKK